MAIIRLYAWHRRLASFSMRDVGCPSRVPKRRRGATAGLPANAGLRGLTAMLDD